MKKLTKEWFKEWSACRDGYEWVLTRKDITLEGTINELIKIDKLDWANWTMARALNKKQRIQYAVFAAEQVIEIFEKKYPNDKRPRAAIEAAKKALERNAKKNRDAAYAAASAAANAASAASAAAYAAYAAYATADVAYAASAASAAYAAANAAASAKEMRIKILEYGLKIAGGK